MDEKDRKLIRMIADLSTVGLTLVFATVIGLFIGHQLDRFFGTSPWLTGLFLLFGIFAGFKNLFVHAKKSQDTFDKNDHEEK